MTHTTLPGWTIAQFDQVAEIVTGSTPSTTMREYYDGPVPFVAPADLDRGLPILRAKSSLSKLGAQQARLVPKGSVLVCCIGATIGKVGIAGTEVATNQQINSLVFNPDKVNCQYAYYYCQTLREIIQHSSTSTTLPILNKGRFSKFEIPLPPLPEQKRIAEILDKADTIRRKRQEALDQAENILRSSYLELFGDPMANPNDWPVENLGSVADMVTGFAFKSSEYTPEGVRLCRGANVLPDLIDWSDVRFWRLDDSTIDPRMKLVAGDVVLAMDRPWISTGIKVAQITDVDLPAYLVQRVTRLRREGFISNAFLYYTIRHPAFTAHCGGLKTETTIPHISSADIKSFPVPVAPKHIHERFELLAKNTQTAIQKLRLAADEAASLFNSLVQRAFKGDL